MAQRRFSVIFGSLCQSCYIFGQLFYLSSIVWVDLAKSCLVMAVYHVLDRQKSNNTSGSKFSFPSCIFRPNSYIRCHIFRSTFNTKHYISKSPAIFYRQLPLLPPFRETLTDDVKHDVACIRKSDSFKWS